jgi:hypothetical protein
MKRSHLLKQLNDFALVHERKAHGCMIDGLPKARAEYARKAKTLREAIIQLQLSTQSAEVRPTLLKQLNTFAGRMEWYVVWTKSESDRNFWTDMAVLLRETIKQLTE